MLFLFCVRRKGLERAEKEMTQCVISPPGRDSAGGWLRPLTVATVTTLRKDLLPDFRRERRSMQPCNSRSYPRNSGKISLSRAPTTIYIILPFRWFLFLIDRERRSMQSCNLRSYRLVAPACGRHRYHPAKGSFARFPSGASLNATMQFTLLPLELGQNLSFSGAKYIATALCRFASFRYRF